MARIRTIKPDFFTSNDIVDMTPFARLFYIATWCEADKEGRLQWDLRMLKRRYFPDDALDINELAKELLNQGLIVLYGDGLAYIPKFKQHQHINPREAASTLPAPDQLPRPPSTSANLADLDASVSPASPPPALDFGDPRDACSTRRDASVTGREEGRKGREGKDKEDDDPGGPSNGLDPVKEFFDLGVSILTRGGQSERNARGLLGRLRQTVGDEKSAAIVMAARSTTDPAAYIARAMLPKRRELSL